ncbi:hypothetical protein EMCG_05611 [[Emmonsia] crescens]|uniref:Uncharacterized protein n=1 Tax=[Emmonsia] crescens TaxID=73230 RepID=A0A0G2IDZ8_9EURO|nr:hypothetical protein EMCG_05611 [Emmonsia crescens UAMH 3008]
MSASGPSGSRRDPQGEDLFDEHPPVNDETDKITVIDMNFTRLCGMGFPEAEAAKLACECWLQAQGVDLSSRAGSPPPSQPNTFMMMTFKFREFKDDYSHVDMKINTNLSGTNDYNNWRREVELKAILIDASLHVKFNEQTLTQSKLNQADDDGTTKMRRAAALWQAVELEYQVHWADLQFRLYNRVAAISIDDYEKAIRLYAKHWRATINEINTHEWSILKDFLAQRFIHRLRSHVQSYIHLKSLCQGLPKMSVSEVNLDELIDDLVRYKMIVKSDTKDKKSLAVKENDKDKDKEKDKANNKEKDEVNKEKSESKRD